jgi:uncharacterized protein YqjF (DUF2071 family)
MRDIALPSRPWLGRMRWCDLAFLHWPVAADALRPLVPAMLQIDTYDGAAWVGVVPFRMEGVRLRGAPPVPTTHAFPEINVRTYVRAAGRAGVWFFSLDAASKLAVRGARRLYTLPYFDAKITVTVGSGAVDYHSVRSHRAAPPAEFKGRYSPIGGQYRASPDTLDHFLVERYCLFMHDDDRGLGLLDIDHEPWPLHRGVADIAANTMAAAAGIDLPCVEPLVHYAHRLDVRAWNREPVGTP